MSSRRDIFKPHLPRITHPYPILLGTRRMFAHQYQLCQPKQTKIQFNYWLVSALIEIEFNRIQQLETKPMEDFFNYNPSHDYQGDQMWKLMKMVTPEENPAVYMSAHYDPLHQVNQRISSSPINQHISFDADFIKIEEGPQNHRNDDNVKIEDRANQHDNQEKVKIQDPADQCKAERPEQTIEQTSNGNSQIKDKIRRKNKLITKPIPKIHVKTLKQLQKSLKGKCFQIFGSLYASTDENILNYDIPIIDYSANTDFKADCLTEIVELQDKQLKELQKKMVQSYGVDFIEETKEKKTYKCTQCERIFSKASALGGHVSKMHSLHAQQVKKVNAQKKKQKPN